MEIKLLYSLRVLGFACASIIFGPGGSYALETPSRSPDWSKVAEADLVLMGDYEGRWLDAPEKSYQSINPSLAAQVINVMDGVYRVVFVPNLDVRAEAYFDGEARLVRDKIIGQSGGWVFQVDATGLRGQAVIGNNLVGFSLKRVERASPTLGARPPSGSIVLFDGSNFDHWVHEDGRAVTWTLLSDGSMEINPRSANQGVEPAIGGQIRTKREFADCHLHIEFRYPVEPGKTGQGRGNSGVFLQGAYEAQLLNSYGLAGNWNELGSLYRLSPPRVNAARPPMQWQTYDIEYRAPRFENGKLKENARMTVRLNGVLVQVDTEIIHHTAHREADRALPAPSKPGPILLQDHSNRIQFRNIWVVER
jgi:hypothetical protein